MSCITENTIMITRNERDNFLKEYEQYCEQYGINGFKSVFSNEKYEVFIFDCNGNNPWIIENTKKDRTTEDNLKLLEEIISCVKDMEYRNIGCRVQYTAILDEEKIEEEAREICEKILNQFIVYNGKRGKIKVVGEYNRRKEYGFFKERAKSTYYRVSFKDLVVMKINEQESE